MSLALFASSPVSWAKPVSDREAQQIATNAYIYGVPMVTVYSTLYEFSVDKGNPQYKGPFNSILNVARVFTPDDTAFVTPNSDTPYTFIGPDLRAEPMVLTVPAMEKNRYFVFQMMDLYTFNFDYVGSRTTGNNGGDFLIAGPNWKGQIPKGITKVIRSETQLVNVVGRTQLFNPGDLDNVRKIQAGYKLRPLSEYLGRPAPPPAPEVRWIRPMVPAEQSKSLEFFNQLAFLLQFTSVNPAEAALRKRFESIGIVPGKPFDTASMSDSRKTALLNGMADGQKEIDAYRATLGGKSADLFGSRAFLKNNYLKRATGTQVGIGANSKDEALYPIYDEGQRRQAARRNQRPLRPALCRREVSAGQRLLVADDVRAAKPVAGEESDQPLPRQFPDAAEPQARRGRRAYDLHPERIPGPRQGIELAAGAERAVHDGGALLLAET